MNILKSDTIYRSRHLACLLQSRCLFYIIYPTYWSVCIIFRNLQVILVLFILLQTILSVLREHLCLDYKLLQVFPGQRMSQKAWCVGIVSCKKKKNKNKNEKKLFLLPRSINLFVCWGNILSNTNFVCVTVPSSEFCPHPDKEFQQIWLNCFSVHSLFIYSLFSYLETSLLTVCSCIFISTVPYGLRVLISELFFGWLFFFVLFLKLFWPVFLDKNC